MTMFESVLGKHTSVDIADKREWKKKKIKDDAGQEYEQNTKIVKNWNQKCFLRSSGQVIWWKTRKTDYPHTDRIESIKRFWLMLRIGNFWQSIAKAKEEKPPLEGDPQGNKSYAEKLFERK